MSAQSKLFLRFGYTVLYWGIFFLRSKSLQEGSTEAAACQLTILDAASDLPSCVWFSLAGAFHERADDMP